MLIKYNVSNFKSIGHNVEFSMLPLKNNTDDKFLKTIKTKMGHWQILRRGAFFGPNASGKSTFIESIDFARDFIVEGQKSGKHTGVNQFKGTFEDLKNNSTFQFMFYLNEEIYEYGFTINQKQVHEEWLMILGEKDFLPLFTRLTDSNGKTTIDIESKFARKDSKDRKLSEVLKSSIQENQRNQLFLYKLHENGIKKAEKIVQWFRDIQVIFPSTTFQGLPIRMKIDTEFSEFIAKSLNSLDTGVFNVSVSSDVIDFREFAEKMDLPKKIVNDIEEVKSGIVNLNGKYFIFSEDKLKGTALIQIKFEHNLNGKSVKFNIDEESEGTQRLLDLLPILFIMGKNSTALYFIDEIDRSLHTKLSQHLLNEFILKCDDTLNQIVFTAHDVNLINLENFRQDEIWFVEKNNLGETLIKPLSDFNVAKEQDTIKSYLSGRFGAIPVIREDK